MEPRSGTESARLVSPRGGRADGSLRLKSSGIPSRHTLPWNPILASHHRHLCTPGIPSLVPIALKSHHWYPSPCHPTTGIPGIPSPVPIALASHPGTSGIPSPAPITPASHHRHPWHPITGGYLAHSLAIMTDAAHLLTDVGSMSVSLFSLWVSNRPPTKAMTFGWYRSETLGALVSVLSIWVVTAALVYLAAARIISNDYEIEARAMLATSACAVGVNLVMAYILHQSPAGHGHGTGAYEQLESSVSCQAAFVHVVGDLLQSLSVLVAATIIYFKPQCKIADPISTLFFSVFVLGSTITILRDVFRVLMEGTPRGLEFDVVKEELLGASGVRGVHDLHLWALTLSHPVVSVHVAVGE
ncbi:hypothetical protein HGM15179_013770 [Zosterops borbonicus]|uniref:Probable proton-coupled zinc antiporter SLC30A3 n=1 Tax=Zosterops borbonicus TaxID=364589 RepID=A0A8K1LGP2_9PASS|nr:hypothetical protein HGM15179_013770 [Zosterops borbonicus]